MPTTPNMGMLLPIPTVTPGPTYASENNDAFDVIDGHDHTTGKGVPVPSNGININNDLPYNGFNASDLRSTQFFNNPSPLSLPADITVVYVSGGDLWYNNQLGQQVQITAGASLNAGSIGGIGGDYVGSGALEFYTSASKTFTFWSSTNVPAALDSGPITLRNILLGSNGVTVNPPPSIPANYAITLPADNTAGSLSFLTMDTSNNIAASVPTNSAFVNTNNIVNQSVTQGKLAPRAIGLNVDPGIGGVAISSPITFSASGNANINVPGLTVTLTTTGRPVFIGLQVSDANLTGAIVVNGSGVTIEIFRSPGPTVFLTFIEPPVAGNLIIPPSTVWAIDVNNITAGTYTYGVSSFGGAVGASYEYSNVVMIAYEL